MTTTLKKRVLGLVLATLTVWPAVHHLLASRLDLDPWLLLAWSMYTVPDPRVQVNVAEVRGDRVIPIELRADLRDKARRFAIFRESLGALARPDRLVRDVLAGRAVDGVVVAVRRFELDRRTARIVTRDRVFRYDGDGRPLPESRSP